MTTTKRSKRDDGDPVEKGKTMANETNDFLSDWAAAPASARASAKTTDDEFEEGQAGNDDGKAAGNTADNGDAGTTDDDESLPAGDTNQQGDRQVPLAALKSERQGRKEEREKREAAERRVQELENQLRAPPARQQQTASAAQEVAPPVDFWENPVGFVQQTVAAVRQEYEDRANRQQEVAFRRAENAMRSKHEDFDEVTQLVQEEAARNPSIVPQIFQSDDPAQAMYDLGKRIKDFRDFQTDPEAVRTKLRDEVKAEILAELRGEQDENASNSNRTIPRRPVDLSRQRNAASAGGNAPPDKFNDLFKRG